MQERIKTSHPAFGCIETIHFPLEEWETLTTIGEVFYDYDEYCEYCDDDDDDDDDDNDDEHDGDGMLMSNILMAMMTMIGENFCDDDDDDEK